MEKKNCFATAVLTRADLESRGFDPDIDDTLMDSIAEEMGNMYVARGDYWYDLENACHKYGVKWKGCEE